DVRGTFQAVAVETTNDSEAHSTIDHAHGDMASRRSRVICRQHSTTRSCCGAKFVPIRNTRFRPLSVTLVPADEATMLTAVASSLKQSAAAVPSRPKPEKRH